MEGASKKSARYEEKYKPHVRANLGEPGRFRSQDVPRPTQPHENAEEPYRSVLIKRK
ncbi:hypothetical protein HanIR_Chr17g0880851 [Helianthus annuus]|nr:hypothetical protein HanIR_Chr17g0880851 [Helianthus annuus]